ncbi:MAG: hypothetical protein ACRENN_01525 [Candidatus Eiseniibacteriota bacterium]
MKFVRCFAIVLPIAFAVFGCDRSASTRVLEPPLPPPSKFEVAEAHWDDTPGIIDAAAQSPLLRRALVQSPHPRLTEMRRLAVRAVGTLDDGSTVGATILPYMVDQDPTHAVFVSLLERGETQVAEYSELILGREPTSLETGFAPIHIGNAIAWSKAGTSFFAQANGAIAEVPRARNWMKFIDCAITSAPGGCAAGAQIADQIAPGVPNAERIGCAVGAAVAVAGCAAEHLLK